MLVCREGCRSQVDKYSGAVYKGFSTAAEAESFVGASQASHARSTYGRSRSYHCNTLYNYSTHLIGLIMQFSVAHQNNCVHCFKKIYTLIKKKTLYQVQSMSESGAHRTQRNQPSTG